MRRRARTDANHQQLVDALREMGWTVRQTHQIGNGFPDAVIARRGVLRLVEFKDGAKSKSRQALTDDEVAFHAVMASAGIEVLTVRSVEEARMVR